MRVAMRRTLRVGPQAGTELEDLGVIPNARHEMTRNDVLNGNVDLIEHAGTLLADMPVYRLAVEITSRPENVSVMQVHTENIDQIDCFFDGRPYRSEAVNAAANQVTIELPSGHGRTVLLQGYQKGALVGARRIVL